LQIEYLQLNICTGTSYCSSEEGQRKTRYSNWSNHRHSPVQRQSLDGLLTVTSWKLH